MKNLFSRLTAAEKVARNMFDEQMRLNNVIVDGKLFNFDMLANISKSDLPRAVELMSKLYVNGQLGSQVVQKMFTARHFMEISNLLIQINGDVDTFVNGIAKGVDYSSDMYKAMFNLSEQSKLLGNNLKALIQPALESSRKSLTGMLMNFNDILQDFNKQDTNAITYLFQDLSVSAGASIAQVAGLGLALKTLLPILKTGTSSLAGLLGLGSATALSGGTIAIVIGSLIGLNQLLKMITKDIYELEESVADVNIAFSDIPKAQAQAKSSLSQTNAFITSLQKSIENINKIDMNSLLPTSFNISSLMGEFKSYYDIMENIESLKPVKEELFNLEEDERRLKNINQELDIMKNKINETQKEALKSAFDELTGSYNPFGNREYNFSDFFEKSMDFKDKEKNLQLFYDRYLKLRKIISSDEELLERITRYATENLGFVSEKAVKKAISYIDVTKLDEMENELINIKNKSDKLNESIKNRNNLLEEQAKQADLVKNKMIADISNMNLEIFKKSGGVEINNTLYKGIEGIYAITSSQFSDIANATLQPIIREKNKLQQELAKLWDEKQFIYSDASQANKIQDELNKLSSQQTKIENIRDTFAKNGLGIKEILDDTTKSFLDNLSITSQMIPYIVNLIEMYARLDILRKKGAEANEEDKNEIAYLEAKIRGTKTIIDLTDKENKEKANRNKYTLKHISYQKEELEMELAIAKVGKTKGQQLALEYEYKLKTYKVNKELAELEIKDAREQLEKLKGGIGGHIVKEILKIDPNNTKDLQTAMKKFEQEYPRQGVGDSQKELKDKQDVANNYVKSVIKAKKETTNLEVATKNTFDEINKYAMTLNPYEQMFGFSGKNITEYKQRIQEIFEAQKNEVWEAYSLGNMTIDEAVLSSYNELLKVKQMMSTEEGKSLLAKQLGLKADKDSLTIEQQLEVYYKSIKEKHDDIIKQKENELKKEKELLEIEQYRLKVYSNMGQVIGKLGDTFNSEVLGNLSGVFDSISVLTERSKDPSKSFKWDFKDMNWDEMSVELSKAFESAFDHMSSGSAIGSFVGGITGGGQSSVAAGTLAGLGTGLYGGFDPATSMAIQAGASLIGGMFDTSEKDQAEANRKTKESNKLYNKNTEALQDLADRMSSLSGGVDSLNSSLISAFSKIPTVSNLNNVTDALTSMYNTMNKTRIFNDVAYQVTKTKSSKGFLGIGGGSTSWTETIEVSVQEMLNKYGFKGAIEDMTSDQLRAFSKWLDDFDMGDSDNFSILADAIEDYAESLDTMEKNIEKFFYDTTMESFEGISSLEQEELRQQIEDFYKDLGLQIDDVMSAQIDALADKMSVMVTIMQDVRSNFVSNWREMGTDAGKTFVQSMSPYIDAILTNISQIYYDVYFSDVNEQLEKEFKNLSEKLVELKKQGQDLNWDDVAKELSSSFGDVISVINATKDETESFNTILLELQKQALESGLSLSEIFDLGLVTGTQETVINTFKDALSSSEANSAFTSIGDMVGETIGEALVNKMIDNMMGDKILEMSSQLDKIVSGNLSFDSLAGLASDAMSVGLMMSQESQRLSAIRDMFSWDKDITYASEDNTINYSSGTSQSVQNIYNLSTNMDVSNLVEADSIERLADELLDIMLEKLKTDKGIDLRK